MSGTDYIQTPNLRLFKPNYDADDGQWGFHLNANADVLDALLAQGGTGAFLPIAGGAMTGPMSLAADPASAMQPATKQYTDSHIASTAAAYLPLAGGTMSGALMLTATGGSTARSAQDRAGERLSIKDLGAVGDGVHDDTPAFTAACGLPDGSVVYIPKNTTCSIRVGNYLISNAVSFIGLDRHSSIIRLQPGTISNDLISYTPTSGNINAPLISNLTLDLNGATQPSTTLYCAIVFNSCIGPAARDVSILNFTTGLYGIAFRQSPNFVVDGCYINQPTPMQTAQSKGIVTFELPGPSPGGRVTNNILVGTNVVLSSAQRLYIGNNDISGWGVGAGIATGNTADSVECVIIGNRCHDSMVGTDMFSISPNGIEHWGSQGVVSSNVCWNCSGFGVAVGGMFNLIKSNTCFNNNKFGNATTGGFSASYSTAAYNAAGSTYSGNRAFDNSGGTQYYGIYISNQLTAPIVMNGNDFSGCITGDAYGGVLGVNYHRDEIVSTKAQVTALNANGLTITPGAAASNPILFQTSGTGGIALQNGPLSVGGSGALTIGTSGTNNVLTLTPGYGTANSAILNTLGTAGIVVTPQITLNGGANVNGLVTFTGNANWLQVGNPGTTANIIYIRSASAGTRPSISTGGADTNVDLALQCGGTGNITALSPLAIGAAGPTITSGSAAPATTTPVGSLYLRTGGASGSRLYVSGGAGAWTAVAGV